MKAGGKQEEIISARNLALYLTFPSISLYALSLLLLIIPTTDLHKTCFQSYNMKSAPNGTPSEFAAVLQLPTELLRQIFVDFVQRDKLDALTLSHVCRGWRSVSIGQPELWSSIGVHKAVGIENLTQLYLDRSVGHRHGCAFQRDVRSYRTAFLALGIPSYKVRQEILSR